MKTFVKPRGQTKYKTQFLTFSHLGKFLCRHIIFLTSSPIFVSYILADRSPPLLSTALLGVKPAEVVAISILRDIKVEEVGTREYLYDCRFCAISMTLSDMWIALLGSFDASVLISLNGYYNRTHIG